FVLCGTAALAAAPESLSVPTDAGRAPDHTRRGHSTIRLHDGRILTVGGDRDGTLELFDPATGTVTLVSDRLQQPRFDATLRLLPDGRVVITRGTDAAGNPVRNTEIFEPLARRLRA